MPVSHVVQPGETLIGISEAYGFFAETLWQHPDNAALRERRADMNVLLAGDVVAIPDKRERTVEAATGKRHVYRRRGIPALFRLQLFDGDEPRKDQAYVLTVDRVVLEGKTDGDGVLEQPVPARARQGKLVIGPDQLTVEIRFGELDPLDTPSGVRHRLSNLGYECRDGGDDVLRDALLAFQGRFDLPRTGEPDEATMKKLAALHDETGEIAGPHE